MHQYCFTFRSVTAAQQGMGVLLRYGIRCELTRTPKSLSSYGCGYALWISLADGLKAAGKLRQYGILPVKMIRLYPNGTTEEATL